MKKTLTIFLCGLLTLFSFGCSRNYLSTQETTDNDSLGSPRLSVVHAPTQKADEKNQKDGNSALERADDKTQTDASKTNRNEKNSDTKNTPKTAPKSNKDSDGKTSASSGIKEEQNNGKEEQPKDDNKPMTDSEEGEDKPTSDPKDDGNNPTSDRKDEDSPKSEQEEEKPQKRAMFKLFVNGRELTEISKITLSGNSSAIPLTPILKKLGASVEWNRDMTVMTVRYDGESYEFDEKDYRFDLLVPEGQTKAIKDFDICGINMSENSVIKVLNTLGATVEYNLDDTITVRINGKKTGRIFVNGNDISNGRHIKFNATNEEIPLISVAEALGAKTERSEDNSVITITFAGKAPIKINTKRTDFGILLPPGTEEGVRRIEDDEIILDSESVRIILNRIGAKYRVDRDSLEIRIEKTPRLIVNGKDISRGNSFKFNKTNEELPVTAILKALGAKVEWSDDGTAVTATSDGKTPIVIDTKKSNFGFLIPPGTEEGSRRFENGEIYMDSETVCFLLRRLGATYTTNRALLEIKIDL